MHSIKTDSIHLSVVSPVYMAENIVAELVRQVKTAVADITDNFEIILVNDASPDRSWDKIVAECAADKRVKGINLSRNFGQHYAITAGLHHAQGDWVVVMDCDLQDRPDEIPNLYRKAQEGWDIVLGKRMDRQDMWLKRMSSKIFYLIQGYLTDTKIDNSIGTFRIMNRKVVLAYNQIREQTRFLGGLVSWLGFETTVIEIKHSKRFEGKSTYSFRKLLGLSLNAMLSFSDKPLKFTIKLGVLTLLISTVFIIYKIVLNLFYGHTIIGWSSIIASLFFCTGLIITVLGMVGLYVGRIFNETKQRPVYIVKDHINI